MPGQPQRLAMTGADKRRQWLLDVLSDGAVHSGEALARDIGVTRAAVWKQLKALSRQLGVRVEAVRCKGYRLRRPLELLEPACIWAALEEISDTRIKEIIIHQAIESTNSWLMEQAAVGAQSGTVCFAERQTAGRGRRGRAWVSPYGSNIYVSMLWHYDLPPSSLTGLSLACGVAVARALERLGITGLTLKWPNDLLWNGCKLAGILLEVRGEATGPSYVVAGVGVNTHMDLEDGASIEQAWTALDQIPDEVEWSRNTLAALLAAEVTAAMDKFTIGGFASFLSEWDMRDYLRGQRISVLVGDRCVSGDYAGISADGSLRLSVAGKVAIYNSGEVAVCRVGSG
jgi:BirA family transcriptional regulator, biotin operon repressor / biotin---[acetyl-CoA-carboxylase] ligase